MLKKLSTFGLLLLTGLAPAMAQDAEVEIVDSNGRRVGNAQVVIARQDGDDAKVTQSQSFKVEGDKIVITDQNGETKEIDISGAASVAIQQSTKSVNDNGQQSTVKRAKAVIIDAEGNRQVIELGSPDGGKGIFVGDIPKMEFPEGFMIGNEPMALEFFKGKMPGQIGGNGSKYMIGVHCEPVGEELRSHLNLDSGVGLIVKSVVPDSPSDKTGVKQHDILMNIEDKQLSEIGDLSVVVEEAGSKGSTISLSIIRGGGEVDVELTPAERPKVNVDMMFAPEMDLQIRRMGPGVIIDRQFGGEGAMDELPDDIRSQIQDLMKRVRQMEENMGTSKK